MERCVAAVVLSSLRAARRRCCCAECRIGKTVVSEAACTEDGLRSCAQRRRSCSKRSLTLSAAKERRLALVSPQPLAAAKGQPKMAQAYCVEELGAVHLRLDTFGRGFQTPLSGRSRTQAWDTLSPITATHVSREGELDEAAWGSHAPVTCC